METTGGRGEADGQVQVQGGEADGQAGAACSSLGAQAGQNHPQERRHLPPVNLSTL